MPHALPKPRSYLPIQSLTQPPSHRLTLGVRVPIDNCGGFLSPMDAGSTPDISYNTLADYGNYRSLGSIDIHTPPPPRILG